MIGTLQGSRGIPKRECVDRDSKKGKDRFLGIPKDSEKGMIGIPRDSKKGMIVTLWIPRDSKKGTIR